MTPFEMRLAAAAFNREGLADALREAADEIEQLLDALWQLLDDMGPDGLSVCRAAKDQAMGAYRASVPNEPQAERPRAFNATE